MERSVKARKQYVCDNCGKPIMKGEQHTFGKGKGPRFGDDFYTQIGISFYSYRLCADIDACNQRMLESEESAVEHGQAG